ncbi:receptor-transporting protein 4 [Ixodes scapularis]
MEQVWQAEFQKLFSQYVPQSWYLLPVVQRPIGVNWQTFVDSAKVRFCCEECGHGWTSMKGRISFWFLLTGHGEGLVTFKLYGQQCDKCKVGRYEPAMWYPEEVVKVLVNIYNRVGQVYYGFQQPPIHKNRRPGKPRNPHNADLCQACRDGVCSERSGMEQVWQAEFQKLFSQYVPQSWYLLPVVQRPIGVNWQTFVDSAKVRFCCEVRANACASCLLLGVRF